MESRIQTLREWMVTFRKKTPIKVTYYKDGKALK